mgnify:CR=1 FL=1
MHVIFVAPHFPPNQRRFVEGLKAVGARVTGICDGDPDREVAVARTDQRRKSGVNGEGPSEPSALAQFDDGGILGPGHEVTRFGDVGRGGENGRREPRIVSRTQHIVHREGSGKVRAEALLRR